MSCLYYDLAYVEIYFTWLEHPSVRTIHVPTRRHEIHAAPVTEVGVGAVVTEESRSGVDVYNYLDLRMWLHQIQFITVTTVRPTRDFRMNKIHDVFGRDVPVVQVTDLK